MEFNHEFIEKIIQKYERFIAPFTFGIGFLFDVFTLTRVDLWIDHAVILGYLALAGGGIVLFNFYGSRHSGFWLRDYTVAFLPVLIQFSFGGLFSAFVIFYTKSAAFTRSWLFLLVLAVLLVGNERFRTRYQLLVFQVSIYFIAIFSYAVFLVPLVWKKIGVVMFLASGAVSLAAIALFSLLLFLLVPRQIMMGRRALSYSIGAVFLIFNILYFTNVIPPVPLSLKEAGVYHSVKRLADRSYAVTYEKAPWYLPFRETSRVYHLQPGEPVYCFTSVFAPTDLDVPILHRWFYFDEATRTWVHKDSIRFSIVGGRDGGYRGYSFKTAAIPGKWRVDIATENGQILGRETFRIVTANSPVALEYAVR